MIGIIPANQAEQAKKVSVSRSSVTNRLKISFNRQGNHFFDGIKQSMTLKLVSTGGKLENHYSTLRATKSDVSYGGEASLSERDQFMPRSLVHVPFFILSGSGCESSSFYLRSLVRQALFICLYCKEGRECVLESLQLLGVLVL